MSLAVCAASPLESLQEVASPERTGVRAASRLAEATMLVRDAQSAIEDALRTATAGAPEPGRQAAAHLLAAGGKRIRPLLALLVASAVAGSPVAAASTVATVAELTHLATLLHDDVLDDADTRRGQPAARRIWGNAVSVLAGDWLLVDALAAGHALPSACFVDLLATLRQLVGGEIVQLRGRTQLDLSEEHYTSVIEGKTASLFRWTAQSAAVVAGASPEVAHGAGRYGRQLGLCFQLVDDLLDFIGSEADTGKRVLRDLEEGKVTLPVVLAARKSPEVEKLLAKLHAGDASVVPELARIIRQSGVLTEVRARAEEASELALEGLAALPKSAATELLQGVARELVSRIR